MLIGCSSKQRVVLASRSDSRVAVNICEIEVRFLDSRQEDIPVPLKVRVQCSCATLWRTNNKKIGTLQDWLSPQKGAISVPGWVSTFVPTLSISSARSSILTTTLSLAHSTPKIVDSLKFASENGPHQERRRVLKASRWAMSMTSEANSADRAAPRRPREGTKKIAETTIAATAVA